MVQSDALPTELRGTCHVLGVLCTAKTRPKNIGTFPWNEKNVLCMQWFAIDSVSKKRLCPLRFAVSFKKFLSSFIFSKKFVYKCLTSIVILEKMHTV